MRDTRTGRQTSNVPDNVPNINGDDMERERLIDDLAFLVVRQHQANQRLKADANHSVTFASRSED